MPRVNVSWETRNNSHSFRMDETDFHAPTRLIEVRPDSPRSLRKAVERIAYYFRREFNYDFVQYAAEDDDPHSHAFLWVAPYNLFPEETGGACCFRWREWEDAEPCWGLQWIWLHPYLRRKGLLAQAWPYYQERFGNFFSEPPLSPAMTAFLEVLQENDL